MRHCCVQTFAPVTLEKPKMLLPLVNMPMMDYSIEWLAASEVEEVSLNNSFQLEVCQIMPDSTTFCLAQVFVICCAHAEQIEAHLKNSKYSQQKSMKLHVVVSTSCLSSGEALRLMDQKDLIKSDFVLVSGDVVSNLDLKSIITAHKKRSQEDRHAIMTMVSGRSYLCLLACHVVQRYQC